MELRHLKYFTILAEELNFRRAAERLGIAQPPLSKQIRDLELELEVKLFERNQQRVLLTKAGKVFLKEVRIVMNQVNVAVTRVKQAHQGGATMISIGFSAPAQQVLEKVLIALENFTPKLQISLQELNGIEQLTALKNNRIDLALGYLPNSTLLQKDELENKLEVKAIKTEKFYLAISEKYLALSTAPKFDHLDLLTVDSPVHFQYLEELALNSEFAVSANILSSTTFILAKEQWGSFAEVRLLEALNQINVKPKKIQEVSKMETALSLVAQNFGVTIVNSTFHEFQRSGVHYVNIKENLISRNIGMIWRKDNTSEDLGKIISMVGSEILGKS